MSDTLSTMVSQHCMFHTASRTKHSTALFVSTSLSSSFQIFPYASNLNQPSSIKTFPLSKNETFARIPSENISCKWGERKSILGDAFCVIFVRNCNQVLLLCNLSICWINRRTTKIDFKHVSKPKDKPRQSLLPVDSGHVSMPAAYIYPLPLAASVQDTQQVFIVPKDFYLFAHISTQAQHWVIRL